MSGALPVHQTTPIKPKFDALLLWGTREPELLELRLWYAQDMSTHWVGLLSPAHFMDTFMAKAPCPPPSDIQFPAASSSEKEMYAPMVTAVREQKLSPNFMFYVTAHKRTTRDQLRPDGGVAEHPELSKFGPELDVSGDNTRMTRSRTKASRPPSEAAFNWHTHGLITEFKDALKQDPFYDSDEAKEMKTIEKSDNFSCQNRGQLAHYAAELFNLQHRTHAFQLFIVENCARFIYWDRAGAVVSARFDYIKEPEVLVQFLWNYNFMPPSARGWDMSVSAPTAAERKLFRKNVRRFLKAMNSPTDGQRRIDRADDTLDKAYPTYKMTVGAGKTGEAQDVVLQKPFEICRSPVGRATRAYLAYSLTKQKVVFLKDSWRVDVKGLSDEDSTYFKLIKASVPFIPKVLCAGDVVTDEEVQQTRTEKLARDVSQEWWVSCSSSRTHKHHRIIQELAYSLSTVTNSREYIQAFRDAFITLDSAHKAGILHRDISFNNIMINAEGKVVVNDWDHAGKVKRDSTKRHRVFRTGTWPFMSIAMLQNPMKAHDILDDLECLFWSDLYGASKYFAGNITIDIQDFFHQKEKEINGHVYLVGGAMKHHLLESEELSDMHFECAPLCELIAELAEKWSDYYRAVARPKAKEILDKLRVELSEPSYWIAILDKYLARVDWATNDKIDDRFPPKPTKKIDMEMRERHFSTLLAMEGISRTVDLGNNDEDDSDGEDSDSEDDDNAGPAAALDVTAPLSPLTDLPDEYQSNAGSPPADTLDAQDMLPPPVPPESIFQSDDGSSGSGSQHSALPLPMASSMFNSNGKRTISVYSDDDDVVSESGRDPQSPTPAAKRPKRSTPPPLAAGSGPQSRIRSAFDEHTTRSSEGSDDQRLGPRSL